jgi:hypothetical protein
MLLNPSAASVVFLKFMSDWEKEEGKGGGNRAIMSQWAEWVVNQFKKCAD